MSASRRLITQKRTMGFKLESSPYGAAETLAAADYDFSVYNTEYGPEIENYVRKLARGHYSKDVSIAGRRKFTCTCSVDMHSGSAAATPPQYFQMLRACGLKQVTYGAGVELITDSTYDRVPATIEVVEKQEGTSAKQLVIRGRGCMGNAKLTLDQVGQPVRIDFEFTGALDDVSTRAFASAIVPTAFDTDLPDAVLAATINLFATIQYVDSMTIDLGNVVNLFTDASRKEGYCGARVVDRSPTLEMDPDMLVTDDENWYTRTTDNNTGQFTVTIGDNFHIEAPKAQPTNPYQPGDQDGRVKNTMTFQLQGNIGDDELVIRQGDVS